MGELLLNYHTTGQGSIYVTHPPEAFADLPDSDWELLISQGFVWYLDFVAFAGRGQLFSYRVKVHLLSSLAPRNDVSRQILLPFSVPDEGKLLLGAYTDLPVSFKIPKGKYKLLFETRYFTDEEIRASTEYDFLTDALEDPDTEIGVIEEDRPEICFLTFVPTDEIVQPKIIYPTQEELKQLRIHGTEHSAFEAPQDLKLHNARKPLYT